MTLSNDSQNITANKEDEVLRILVVDDDSSDRELYRLYLMADENNNYTISETELGKEGVELTISTEYDCVLLDYFLPDLDGMGFLKSLQDLPEIDVPIIMLTGHGNESMAVDALKSGAADYLPKRAVSTESLNRAITNVVDKTRLKRAVEEKTRALEHKNKELLRKHDETERFYHSVSHELKTPLTSMKEFISIMLDGLAGPITDDQQEYLLLVQDSCMQMANDVNDLIDVTRMNTGKFRMDVERCNINSLIDKVVRTLQPLTKDKSINLGLSLDENAPEIFIDDRRVEQVLTNLIGNAIKFTEESGDIKVFSKYDADNPEFVEISVRDTGCGIKSQDLLNIFDRLFQVDPESELASYNTSEGGLGLGLAISKEIVDLHYGNISVESEINKGSVFKFTLPLLHEKPEYLH